MKPLAALTLLSTLSLTNCIAPPLKKTHTIEKFQTYEKNDYRVFHFKNGEIWYTNPMLYTKAKICKKLLPIEYQAALENPECLRKVMKIIDSKNDRVITYVEAYNAYFSSETQNKLESILNEEVVNNRSKSVNIENYHLKHNK